MWRAALLIISSFIFQHQVGLVIFPWYNEWAATDSCYRNELATHTNQIGSKIKTLCCHSWEQHMVPYVLNWHLLSFLLLLHKLKVKVMIGKISIRVFLFCSFSLITGDPSGLNQETQTRQKQRRKTVFQRKSQHKSASQSMLSFRGIHK